jgi:hypothetical protein
MLVLRVVTAIMVTTSMFIGSAVADDCDTQAGLQSTDLVTLTKTDIEINDCKTAAGRAAYERNVALLQTLKQRDALLSSICPATDPNWQYVRDTLRIQTDVFSIVSKACAP